MEDQAQRGNPGAQLCKRPGLSWDIRGHRLRWHIIEKKKTRCQEHLEI